jgi:hypothetical protein
MAYDAALAAANRLGGRFAVWTAWSAPTTPREFERREESAAGRQAEHRAIGRVKTTGEQKVDEKGRISFVYKVAGAINRDKHEGGVYLNKAGEPCVDVVISAPTEYGYTTACDYAGVPGSACEKRKPFHAHRTINLSRLVSWMDSGEEQNR